MKRGFFRRQHSTHPFHDVRKDIVWVFGSNTLMWRGLNVVVGLFLFPLNFGDISEQ